MIEAFPILMTPRVVLEQSSKRRDAEFTESSELRTSDPSQFFERDRRGMGRKSSRFLPLAGFLYRLWLGHLNGLLIQGHG
jgi:hypothetical protein